MFSRVCERISYEETENIVYIIADIDVVWVFCQKVGILSQKFEFFDLTHKSNDNKIVVKMTSKISAPKKLFVFNLENVVETLGDSLIPGTSGEITFFWLIYCSNRWKG